MSATPLFTDSISLPARLFNPDQVWAALDQGGSLIKALFIDKEYFGQEYVTVHSYVYKSSDLDAALNVIHERSYIPQKPRPTLNMTGIGYYNNFQRVENQLSVKTVFTDEFVSQARGCIAALRHNPAEALYPPPSGVKNYARSTQLILEEEQKANAVSLTRNNHDNSTILPANFLVIGSAPVAMHITETGEFFPVAINRLGGLPFLGLAKLLLGTSDYDEVMRLAAEGDIRRVDTQVKDVTGRDSEYGSYDPDLPFMTLGKLQMDLEANPRREDVAASLLNLFAGIAFQVAIHTARSTGISRIYVSGNWVRAEVARRVLCEQWNLTLPDGVIEFKFLKCGFITCLGAMLNAEDIDEKLKNL